MTRHAPLWQQNHEYTAQRDRQLFAALWPYGASRGGVCTPVTDTMNVNVTPGIAAVPLASGNGCALCVWDAAETVTLDAAPPSGQQRIDLIVVQVHDALIDGGQADDFVITKVTGVPAASAVAPAVPANAFQMFQIIVPAQVANLNTATFYDWRYGQLGAAPAGRLTKTGGTGNSIPNTGASTVVTLQVTDFLRNGMTVASNGLVVPEGGIYQANGSCVFTNATGGMFTEASRYFNTQLKVNDAVWRQTSGGIAGYIYIPSWECSDLLKLKEGDRVNLGASTNETGCHVWQNTGTFLSLARVA